MRNEGEEKALREPDAEFLEFPKWLKIILLAWPKSRLLIQGSKQKEHCLSLVTVETL